MNLFSFTKLPVIFFGVGAIKNINNLIKASEKVLLVTGKKSFGQSNVGQTILMLLEESGVGYIRYAVSGEPSPDVIDQAINKHKADNITTIVAVGGGSVIDAGKAISAMFCEEGSVKDYLEGVGTKKTSGRRLKLIAIPTTSGTGSEATKNAVISEFGQNGFKKSLRHDNFTPDVAIVDPALVVGCPPEITGASGMDAFTQLLESYLSVASNPITDTLAFSGLKYLANSLKKAYDNGNDINARTNMAYASLVSGICLANAGLGLVHGFAQPLGSLFPVPHGIVCGTLMPAVNRLTVNKLLDEKSHPAVLKKYAEIGNLFTDKKNRAEKYYIELFLDKLDEYVVAFKIPRLSAYGISKDDFQSIIKQTEMKNHPIKLTTQEMESILTDSL